MPYFTKKGSGKDKNKVCVYKKSDKKKVGCTAGPIEKYLTALRMAESDDFDFIKDTDSLNGVRFTIGQSVIPEIIYTVVDDGQDHRVTVVWNEKEDLLRDRDKNYDSIKWVVNTNIRRNGDTLRLFNKYFGEDEFDSSDEEKRERVIDYMINNFEDEDILHYMGSELSDGRVSYNRDVVKKFFEQGDWKIYDKSLNESNDWGWVEDVPGTKEFDQKYRYFEIVACYGIDYESEECDDEYSHYVKIPKHDADEIWDGPFNIEGVEMDYLAGPGDEGLGVIKYSIKNNLIPRYEVLEIIMFEGVRELEEHVYEELTGYRESVNESKDFKWVNDSKPNWRTYYEVILDDVQKLPKNLEDVTDEMLLLIWMKIHTINKEIRKKSDDYPRALYSDKVVKDTFESIIEVEWLFGKIMALVAGKVDTSIKPQDYYEARKINIITNIKGILSQLELIGESNDLGWIEDVGQNRTYVLDKLKKFFNEKGISVDWEHDYDEKQTSHGNTEVYFGRFWFDGKNNNEYFIELYESDGGEMIFDIYVYDKKDDQYYRDEGYGDEQRINPSKADDFWRLVAWLVLMKKGMHRSSNAKEMKESKDFNWIEDVTPRMDATLLKPGQKFYDKWGDVIRVLEYLGRDDEGEVCYKPPCSLLRFRKIKDPSGYRMIPALPADDPQNTDMIMIPKEFDSYIESGKLKLVSKRTMYESEDFVSESEDLDWIQDVKTQKGTVIKKSPKYGVGKQVGGIIYLHKSVEDRLPKELLDKVKIKLPTTFQYDIVKYDEKNDNVTFISSPDWDSADEPIVGDAFLIRRDGSTRYMKQKKSPQIYHHKWLFVNNDYSGFNTEESKERSSNWLKLPDIEFSKIGYKNYWDTNVVPHLNENKIMKKELITEMSYTDINSDEIMRANKSSRSSGAVGPKALTPRMVLQYIKDTGNKDIKILDFGSGKDAKHTYALRDMGLDVTAHDFSSNINDEHHDPNALERVYDIVFASNVLNVQGSENMMRRTVEDVLNTMTNDSIFIANFPSSPRYGFETAKEAKEILEDYFDIVVIHGSDGGRTSSPVWAMSKKSEIVESFKWGDFKKLGNDFVSESEDLDWIKNVKLQGFEKSKSYVVDVSNLMIDTPMSVPPTSEEYTKLTRADVLDKFKELGYNVDEIPIGDADYLYIEPNDEAGYWDDTVWVNQTHWVDYDMEHNTPDPTYNGKYEVMDVNDLMFLLDNKMVSESNDFEWIEDVPLTMNVCDAYYVLNPGDEIIINEIDNWEDNPNQWDSENTITTHHNVKAKVLALDECNNIHKTNECNNNTILVSIDEDGFYGFDEMWSSEFVGDFPSKCRNNNCMFLICEDGEPDYEIRLVEKNKKPITEVAGISFESREWAKIINDEILKNPNEKERLIIDGYDYPEAFNSFPIDYVVIDFYDKLTGYGQEHSGYDKDGNYVVLLYIQPKIVSGVGGYNLRTVLNHEMKHAWDDYNRLSKGQPSIDKNKENRELYNKDFILMLSDKNVRGPIKQLLKYYYYLSELEKTAYLENVYDGNLNYEKVIRDISSKDFESFKDRFDLDINWHLMNTAYDIPFLKKFKSPIEFINYSSEELRSRAIDMIKKINKMKYVHGID